MGDSHVRAGQPFPERAFSAQCGPNLWNEGSRPNPKSFPGSGSVRLVLQPKWEQCEEERDTAAARGSGKRRAPRTDRCPVSERFRPPLSAAPGDMLLVGPKALLLLTALVVPSDWTPLGVRGQRGVLADVGSPAEDLASPSDKNATAECRDEKFACTRLYSVHRPVRQCIHQLCFTSLRRMYIVNKEVCSRLVCKEHEVMKDELCRQMAGLPPRRLRRSNYFRLPPCEDVDVQRPIGL
ncbi:Microfibrillar-associated protein 5 [Tupaia chinensis]|uniref:Microfibrillar-associated protein 5 n=1 Tax=Tupaia chinensis TaxID=246437 RepID=L9L2J5_TUPCH|nr:Microfibrillar-associated protein 5 [Tupaia chinensis]